MHHEHSRLPTLPGRRRPGADGRATKARRQVRGQKGEVMSEIKPWQADFEEDGNKLCHKCGEYWPPAEEFFYIKGGHASSPCKACISEQRKITNLTKSCCVPSCDEPRAGGRSSRCRIHQSQYGKVHYALQKRTKSR